MWTHKPRFASLCPGLSQLYSVDGGRVGAQHGDPGTVNHNPITVHCNVSGDNMATRACMSLELTIITIYGHYYHISNAVLLLRVLRADLLLTKPLVLPLLLLLLYTRPISEYYHIWTYVL
jgi:hypothetical protein